MIITVIGIPGSGKSFWAVKTSLEYIASGGVVFSNIKMKGVVKSSDEGVFRYSLPPSSPACEYLRKYMKWEYKEGQYSYIDLDEYSSSFLSMIPHGEQGKRILLILDEVNEWFDSLDRGKLTKDEKYRELFKFLRLSRHYHIDVVFLLQDFNTLNPRLRGLCAKIIEATDMQKMRIGGFPIPFPFPWFLWKEYDNKGKHVLRSETWVKDAKIFACYDSFCEVGSVGLSGQLVKTDFSDSTQKKVKVKKMNWLERCLLYSVLGFLLWSWSGNEKREKALKADLLKAVAVRSVAVVSNHVEKASAVPVVSPSAALPRREIKYASFSYALLASGREVLYIDGVEMVAGRWYEHGQLNYFSENIAQFVRDDLTMVYVYPRKEGSENVVALGSRPVVESRP